MPRVSNQIAEVDGQHADHLTTTAKLMNFTSHLINSLLTEK